MKSRVLLFPMLVLLSGCAAHRRHAACPREGGPPWHELTSDHFRMRTNMDPQGAHRTLRQLERYRRALLLHWDDRFDPPSRVDVVALQRPMELREFAPEGVGGYAVRRPQGPLIVFAGDGGYLLGDGAALDGTPRHELVHSLSWYVMPRQPRWYSEGLAGYLQTVSVSEDGTNVVLGGSFVPWGGQSMSGSLFWWAHDGGLLTLSQLWQWGREAPSPADVSRYYGSSWLWVKYLLGHHAVRFADFERRLARREEPRSAFDAAFAGVDMARVHDDAVKSMRFDYWILASRWGVRRLKMPPVEEHATERLMEPAEVHALRAELRASSVQSSTREALAAALREEVEAAVAESPNSLHTRLLQARYAEAGAERAAMARTLAREHPQSAEAWRLLGDSLDEAGESRDERKRAYQRVLELTPDDVVANHALAWSYVREGAPMKALPLGKRAVELTPWNPSYLETYAAALAGVGRCRDAAVYQGMAVSVLGDRTPAVVRARYVGKAAEYERCSAASR